jgi:hypothetical protein
MQFQVGSTDKMRITSSGNVGIGTTSPSEKLDVEGNVRVGVNNGFYINNQNVGIKRTSNDLVLGGFGNVIIRSSSTTVVNQVERMRITSAGNVGIGTTSPTYILDVVSSGTATARLKSAGTGAISLRYENGGGFKSAAVVDNNGLYRLDATNISLNPTNNVGIGTTSPQTKLQVEYTDTHTSGDLALANSAFDIYNDSTTDVAGKGSTITFSDNYLGTNKTTRAAIKGGTDTAGNTADGFLAFYTDSSSANSMQQRMIINHDGRVSFNYYGSGSFTGTATESLAVDASGNVIEIPIGSGPVDGSGTANYSARWIDTDTLGIGTLYDNGTNVGIGTSSPNQKLEVSGNSLVTGTQFIGDTFTKIQQASGNLLLTNQSLSGAITFLTNSTEQVRITSSGNVGIGTTSPIYKLDANGGVRAGGVITYSKPYSNLTTTGQAVAGLTSSSNGNSTGFTFTCFGHTGGYQKIVYSCRNELGTWKTKKVINEGTNDFDVEASADGSTITFTFKSTSGTKSYTPRVTIEATGHSINSTYA